jgi:hypothetical protein
MAQLRELRHLFLEGWHMINKAPVHESDRLPDDELRNVQALTYKPKAAFQWPPECLWPFINDGLHRDT